MFVEDWVGTNGLRVYGIGHEKVRDDSRHRDALGRLFASLRNLGQHRSPPSSVFPAAPHDRPRAMAGMGHGGISWIVKTSQVSPTVRGHDGTTDRSVGACAPEDHLCSLPGQPLLPGRLGDRL